MTAMRHNMPRYIAVLFVLMALPGKSLAEEADKGGAVKTVTNFVRKVGTIIDSMSVKGVDLRYIAAPRLPWQIIVRGNTNQTELKMRSVVNTSDMPELGKDYLLWEPSIKNTPSSYTGVWAGYRGYGLGISKNVGGDKGTYLTFGATGGSYGLNIRIHRFEESDAKLRFSAKIENDPFNTTMPIELLSPITIRSVIADGYYMLNGKRFSYAAAYDQSVVQLRSAGSLMVGAMYYHATMDYAQSLDADFINLMDDIGRIKQWQGSLGVGYAYNFVPAKGWLISVMAMPMLSIYNQVNIWRYDSDLIEHTEAIDEYMEKLANEEITDEQYFAEYEKAMSQVTLTVREKEKRTSSLKPNIDARLSLTYQWDRFFINAYGQYNRFKYRHSNNSGSLSDWFINAAVGIRL